MVVREIKIVGRAAEGELQDRHAGETGRFAQGDHRRHELAEVLGDQFRVGHFGAQRFEKREARARFPAAFARIR